MTGTGNRTSRSIGNPDIMPSAKSCTSSIPTSARFPKNELTSSSDGKLSNKLPKSGKLKSVGSSPVMKSITPPMVLLKPSPIPSAMLSPISAKTFDGDAMPRNDLTLSTIFPKKPGIMPINHSPVSEIPVHKPFTIATPTSINSPGMFMAASTNAPPMLTIADNTSGRAFNMPPAKCRISSTPVCTKAGASARM